MVSRLLSNKRSFADFPLEWKTICGARVQRLTSWKEQDSDQRDWLYRNNDLHRLLSTGNHGFDPILSTENHDHRTLVSGKARLIRPLFSFTSVARGG
jgi:hypothetical protein